MTPELPSGKYRHYKGAEYWVEGLARHSETEEWLVVYRPSYQPESLWVRPLEMFTETVNLDGQPVARFQYLGPK